MEYTEIRHAYLRLFSSGDGQIVRQHLLDNIYNTVYEGTNLHEAFAHGVRRTVIQEILDNIKPLPPEDDHA